ncbi:L,D-transpeptidase family protein [Sphingomonas sp. 28-63-12]|uniref:L,D-transpeptidase family protein n=1 Tax=Sphingomonas sp. 28-63-12 TaxID=1970434 RepID=UPI0035A9068D
MKFGGQIIGMMILAGLLAAATILLASGALRARPTASLPSPAPSAVRTDSTPRPPSVAAVHRSEAMARASPPAPAPVAPSAATPASTAYVIKHILPIEGPLHLGDHYWDERGAPAGPILITVDLAAQTLSVFRGGYEIGTAAILYGADDKPTPLGVFPITEKDADHVSNLYDAPMPYMLRLTNSGISIHGTSVADGYMTHGCIGVPTPFARQLFNAAKLGDKVIVTRGEMLDIGAAISAA